MRTKIFAVASAVFAIGTVLIVNLWPPAPDEQEPPPPAEPLAEAISGDPQPAAPVVEPAPEPIVPSFDVVRISREGTGVIAGRAEPNAEVTIRAGDQIIGTTVANRNSEWVLIFDDPLEPGTRELGLVAELPGEDPVESDSVVIVSLPPREVAPARPAEPEGVVAVLTPRYGGGASRVLQKPGMVLEENLDQRLLVETIDYDDSGHAVIAGRTAPDGEVRVYLDNRYLATVMGDEAGYWLFEPAEPVTPGPHTLRLDQMLGGDDVEIRVEQPFDRQSPLDVTLAEGHVVIRPGNNLWRIARRIYGAGIQYTVIYRANQERIRNPDLIYPGQKFALPPPDMTD